MKNTPMADGTRTRSSKRVLAAAPAAAPATALTKRSKTTAAAEAAAAEEEAAAAHAAAEEEAAEEEAAAAAHAAAQAKALVKTKKFASEIEHYDWKVNEEVCGVFGNSLYGGIQTQFNCIAENFLYGLTEGSIINSPEGSSIVFVIYYKGEFPSPIIPGSTIPSSTTRGLTVPEVLTVQKPEPDKVYKSGTKVFDLFWKAMIDVNYKGNIRGRTEGVQIIRKGEFVNIQEGSAVGWNICFLHSGTVYVDMPGTYLQLIPKQPAGGRPKQNQKNKKNKNIKRKTKKLRKRTTKRKSKRTRKSRKH
jgi:hypothetical protein